MSDYHIKLIERRKKHYVTIHYPHFFNDEMSAELKENIKKIPGRKFNWNEYFWEVPLNKTTLEYLDAFCSYYNFETPLEFKVFVEQLKELNKENKILSAAESTDFIIPNLKLTLRPFQAAGVQYILKNKRVLLGDEQGLGKTPQAIASFFTLGKYPITIICPNSLKLNWYYEILKWIDIDKERISVIRNNKKDNFEADIIIIHYQALTKYLKILEKKKIKLLIVDESHFVKSHKSQRSKAVFTLSRKVEYKMLLTGTPTGDAPLDLVHQLKILDRLQDFGGSQNFKLRYCDAKEGYYGWEYGASNLEELHEKLRQVCYIRRNKKDVLKELPDKVRSIVYLDIDNRKEYELAKRDLVNFILKNKVVNEDINDDEIPTVLNALNSKLEKIEAINKVSKYEALIRANYLRQLTAHGKLNNVIEWIYTFLQSGQKLVCFAYHVAILDSIADHFKCNRIYGGTPVEQRQEYVQKFQDDPNEKLIVLNIDSGKVGFNLTAASNLAVVELSWMPDDLLQLEDRIHRMGQENVANIYYLLGADTFDINMYDVLEDKMVITNAINAGIKYEAKYIGNKKQSIFKDIINQLIK